MIQLWAAFPLMMDGRYTFLATIDTYLYNKLIALAHVPQS